MMVSQLYLVMERFTISHGVAANLSGPRSPVTEIPRTDLEAGISPIDHAGGEQGLGAQADRRRGGYLSNVRQVQTPKMVTRDDLKWPAAILLRRGKKNYHLVTMG